MTKTELKPIYCPCCYSKDITYGMRDTRSAFSEYYVRCMDCELEMTAFSIETAIERWNTRKPMELLVDRMKEMRDDDNICNKLRNINPKHCKYTRGCGECLLNQTIDIIEKGNME